MNAAIKSPTLPGMATALAKFSAGFLLCIIIWLVDPTFESKAHGPLLIGLAFLFIIQDTLVGSFRKRKEEATKISGIKTTLLPELFDRLNRLSDLADRMWWIATILRGLTLIAGFSLMYGNPGYYVRAALVLGGYFGTALALILCLRTYILYRHVDSFVNKKEEENRINTGRSDSATKLESSVKPGWDDTLKKGGYDKLQISIKPS